MPGQAYRVRLQYAFESVDPANRRFDNPRWNDGLVLSGNTLAAAGLGLPALYAQTGLAIAFDAIEHLAKFVEGEKFIALVGFADFSGNRSKNFELSYRRARLTLEDLMDRAEEKGVNLDPNLVRLRGTGEIFRPVDIYVCDLPPDTPT